MSLDTVLQIGNTLRKSEKSLKYYKYIAKPTPLKGNTPTYLSIPLNEDYSFNWLNVKLVPENEQGDLHYLIYKTSGNDSSVKYVFSDIFYEVKSTISKDGTINNNIGGYYRLADANKKSSFFRGNSDFNSIQKNEKDDSVIVKFHKALKNEIKVIEQTLKYGYLVEDFFIQSDLKDFKDFMSDETQVKSKAAKKIFKDLSKQNRKKLGLPDNIEDLEQKHNEILLTYSNYSIFIHFELPKKKHWYQFEDAMLAINSKMLSEFVENSNDGLVLTKSLYKTLCSGDKKNDIQYPSFRQENKHKSKLFDNSSIQDLFYAIDYTSKGKIISGTDIKLIVLPRGENLKAEDYDEFLNTRDEAKIVSTNTEDDNSFNEPWLEFLSEEGTAITSFDLIFCKKAASASSPDVDLIELSGLQKSKLRTIRERIFEIASEIYEERKGYIGTDKNLFPLQIGSSLKSILGTPQHDTKKGKVVFKINPCYQSHVLKVAPLIYTENYHSDSILLPAFIQNNEYAIRAGDNKYNFLKYDLKFLFKIQNSKNDTYMEITTSESYHVGLLLGELARNLSQEINSFEKNYVGNLTRRIGTMSDFIKLKTDIEQKLIMHDKSKFTFQISYDLAQKVKEFKTRYDKEECAFGFMESYFKPNPKNTDKKD